MKKALFLILVAIVTIATMSACRIEKAYDTKEPAKTYHLNLTGFTSLRNASNCDIHFTQSDTYKVTLKATPAWYDRYSVRVENGALVIRDDKYKKQKGVTVLFVTNNNAQAEMWVSAPSLNEVSMSGSGDFSIDNNFIGKSLSIVCAGSSVITTKNLTLTGDFEYSVAGSGDVKTGTVKANTASFSVSGSGDVESGLAGVASTSLSISGSGDADLKFYGCDDADVSVSGSGDLTLSGQLKTLTKRVSGSGDVDMSGLRLGK